MTEHKKIENLLRTAKFESNQEVNKSVLQNLLEHLDKDNVQISKEPGIRRIIMRSKFSKLTAAAIVLILVLTGIFYFGDNSHSVALGAVVESMQKMSWIHAKSTVQQAGQTQMGESWECFNLKINIIIDTDGVISYRDYGNEVAYFYQPSTNEITISPTTDRYNQTTPESPTEIVQFMIEQFESQGSQVTRKKSTMGNVPVEIFNIVDERQNLILIVDAQKNLPISIETIARVPEMNLEATISTVLNYPEQGPVNIYSLGVPEDAKIIDNRPEGNTRNIINEIQKRYDSGFEDHIAVVFESQIKDNNVLKPVEMIVMRQKGRLKRLDRYDVYDRTGSNITTLYSSVKDNWPELTIQNVLGLEDDIYAEYQLVFDGKTSYIRSNYSGQESIDSVNTDFFLVGGVESLIGYSLINPSALMMTGPGQQVKFEIVPEDPNHAGLVGLRLTETMDETLQKQQGTDIKERNTFYWFDPAKDYLIVERKNVNISDNGIYTIVEKTIETAQTESGKWYPKVMVTEKPSPDGQTSRTIRETRIIVDTSPVFKEGIFEEIKASK